MSLTCNLHKPDVLYGHVLVLLVDIVTIKEAGISMLLIVCKCDSPMRVSIESSNTWVPLCKTLSPLSVQLHPRWCY